MNFSHQLNRPLGEFYQLVVIRQPEMIFLQIVDRLGNVAAAADFEFREYVKLVADMAEVLGLPIYVGKPTEESAA